MNIFVAKLNYSTQEDSLMSLFQQFGEVESVKIIMDRETGRSKGYGFVIMPNDDEASDAIAALNDREFEERTLAVKEARPQEKKFNNRGGGGYNKGGYNKRPYNRDRDNGGGYNKY